VSAPDHAHVLGGLYFRLGLDVREVVPSEVLAPEHAEQVVHDGGRELHVGVTIDDALPNGSVVVRDVLGVMVTDVIKLVKPDMDRGPAPARTELLG
jgi:hypothetical protein